MQKRSKTAIQAYTEAVELVIGDVCDNYCKWSEMMDGTDEEQYNKLLKEHCEKCPLTEII